MKTLIYALLFLIISTFSYSQCDLYNPCMDIDSLLAGAGNRTFVDSIWSFRQNAPYITTASIPTNVVRRTELQDTASAIRTTVNTKQAYADTNSGIFDETRYSNDNRSHSWIPDQAFADDVSITDTGFIGTVSATNAQLGTTNITGTATLSGTVNFTSAVVSPSFQNAVTPFQVTAMGKVANLNADKVDGKDTTDFIFNSDTSVFVETKYSNDSRTHTWTGTGNIFEAGLQVGKLGVGGNSGELYVVNSPSTKVTIGAFSGTNRSINLPNNDGTVILDPDTTIIHNGYVKRINDSVGVRQRYADTLGFDETKTSNDNRAHNWITGQAINGLLTLGSSASVTGISRYYMSGETHYSEIYADPTDGNQSFKLPYKGEGTYTLATTGDITADSVLNLAGTGVALRKVGTGKSLKRLKGTTNQVTVTDNTDSVTFSLPQNINTTADPTFDDMTLNTLILDLGSGSTTTLSTDGGGALINSGSIFSGSTAANGSARIIGTTSVTKTTSYVTLQETGGNVGIGTSSPVDFFTIYKTASPIMHFQNSGSGTNSTDGFLFEFGVGGGAAVDAQLWNFENGYLRFGTNNNQRMTILNSGEVGIGDATPSSLFTVGSGDLFQVNSSGQNVKENNLTLEGNNGFAHDTVVNLRSTNLTATNYANVSGAGDYEVYGYFQVTAGGTGVATATVTIGWTDDIGATTNNVVNAIVATGTSRNTFVLPLHVASGNITYAITLAGTTNPTVKLSTWIRKVVGN